MTVTVLPRWQRRPSERWLPRTDIKEGENHDSYHYFNLLATA